MNREAAAFNASALPPRLADWKGTDRYQVRRCIGTGGMGTVYEAFDCERKQSVAIKRLRHFSPAALYLFKQEFRTLADVVHPNLVRLYELVATEAQDVFFAMELVQGTEFLTHVRGEGPADLERLRATLLQLVDGVQALHAARKLHRDIKPSNVLVTSEGRVVLLDFGVAIDLSDPADGDAREEEPIVGTAPYMAPEQASGATATAASDWYSVGAILFEALVGSPPFVGSTSDVIRMKIAVDPPLASTRAQDVPADLDALCGALLARAVVARPSGPEILRRLGVTRTARSGAPRLSTSTAPSRALSGHQTHLASLRDAFDVARAGRCVTVRVGGPSGMGKTSLVQHFLEELATRGDTVILGGRAYERESVPYKAIDSWVDALSRHLLRLSDVGTQVALPKDVWALARLFPVLRRVPEIADMREQVVGDPQRVRRRAFLALRQLLATLAQQHPTVIHLDDAHWGDSDSAALLIELVRPPDAPPVLLVMTSRDEEARASPFLAETRAHWPEGSEVRDLTVGPLDFDDSRRLALTLLGSDDATAQSRAAAAARESRGNPFLLDELVRGHPATTNAGKTSITLEELAAERLAQLPDGPRRLLEMIAVSGRPLDVATVGAAAGIDSGLDDALSVLQVTRFVHVGLRNGREVVETTHDRIGDAVVAGLSSARAKSHHGRLASALESAADADPESVALHLVGAGEEEKAAPYAERAAERAVGMLAFDRAVQLFRMALRSARPRTPEASRLRVRLAEALAWAGRGEEAGRAYLEAAADSDGSSRIELERAAAEQLLASGRIDEGALVLRGVLAAIDVKAPRSTASALFWLVIYRIWLRAIGLRHAEREPKDVGHQDRLRIDTMYAVALGLAVVDVLLGACMQARLFILALRAGDRRQVIQAAALEAGQLASLGGPEGRRERALIEMARGLAPRSGDIESEAVLEAAVGIGLFLRGRWKESREKLEAVSAKLQQGRSHSRANAIIFGTNSLYFSGDIKELVRRHGRAIADAEERGDLYTKINFATATTITTHLVADDPEGARRQMREGLAQWSQRAFFVQHWQAMTFAPDIALYMGEGSSAYDHFTMQLPELKRSLLLNVQFVRGLTLYVQGRCAVGSLGRHPELRRVRVAEARRAARRLRAERMAWTVTLAAVVEAAAENAAGNQVAAVAALRAAVGSAEDSLMAMHATVARHRLGTVIGGDEGRALVDRANETLAREGIACPERWMAIYLPGVWKASA
ncbi:MAG: protein kinase domain-containing protein [Polyangiaceae bacterium]